MCKWRKGKAPDAVGYWWVRCRLGGSHEGCDETLYAGEDGPVLAVVIGSLVPGDGKPELYLSTQGSWFYPLRSWDFVGGGCQPAELPEAPRAGWKPLPRWRRGVRPSGEIDCTRELLAKETT